MVIYDIPHPLQRILCTLLQVRGRADGHYCTDPFGHDRLFWMLRTLQHRMAHDHTPRLQGRPR